MRTVPALAVAACCAALLSAGCKSKKDERPRTPRAAALPVADRPAVLAVLAEASPRGGSRRGAAPRRGGTSSCSPSGEGGSPGSPTRSGKLRVIHNGRAGPSYESVMSPTISPDGRARRVRRPRRWHVAHGRRRRRARRLRRGSGRRRSARTARTSRTPCGTGWSGTSSSTGCRAAGRLRGTSPSCSRPTPRTSRTSSSMKAASGAGSSSPISRSSGRRSSSRASPCSSRTIPGPGSRRSPSATGSSAS